MYLTFEGGPNPPTGVRILLVDLAPRGFISARRFGPGGPYLLVDMDRGSKSTGVQINWDTCRCYVHTVIRDDQLIQAVLPRTQICIFSDNFCGVV
jgi:hypothetical protein